MCWRVHPSHFVVEGHSIHGRSIGLTKRLDFIVGIIAFAFGDALLYVIPSVHADAFGVSMLMVGFLLAVNRIIRTFAYGFIADLAERIGLKKMCLFAASSATLSTAGYGFFEGEILLTMSRMVWGLSFAALLLVTLSYAAANPLKTGTRIGLSRSVEQVGPLLAMTVGAWLATIAGPRDVLYICRWQQQFQYVLHLG